MSRPYILISGLRPDHPKVPAHMHEAIRVGIQNNLQMMDEAGYEVQGAFSTPEPNGLEEFLKHLKAERKPDGVVIGYGVRGSKELSIMFEDMVNAVVEHAPTAKLVFNTTPEDTVEHLQRLVPAPKK